jgi:hypothetical protein
MTRFRLDTIGLAGFSHDFGALDSKPSAVATAFADFAGAGMGLGDAFVFFAQFLFPEINSLPTPRQRAINNLHRASGELAKEITAKAEKEEKGERSVMGLMSQLLTSPLATSSDPTQSRPHLRTQGSNSRRRKSPPRSGLSSWQGTKQHRVRTFLPFLSVIDIPSGWG